MSVNFETQSVSKSDPLTFDDIPTQSVQKQKSVDTVPDPKVSERSSTPELPKSTVSIVDIDMSQFVGIPSPGANLLALLSELTDDQRRANRDQIMAQKQAAVANLKEQATEIRDQAVANLAMGCVSAGLQGFISLGSAIATSSAISSTSNIADAGMQAAVLQARTSKIQSVSQAVSGLPQILDQAKGFVSSQHDATLKDKEAQLEMIRAMTAQLESLDSSLEELIVKTRESRQEIQQSTNQTRTRILG